MQQKGLAMAGHAPILDPCCTATWSGQSKKSLQPLHFPEIPMLTAEQMLAAQKANVETLFGLTAKAFEGVEKLVELNLTATKAALTEAAETTQSMLSVKDAQELMALQASLFQPLAEKTAAYSRHLYDISSSAGAEFGKTFE